MNPRPTVDHFRILVRHTLATLPDSLRERKILLVTLHAIMPRDYEHDGELESLIITLRQHEERQLKFAALLDQPKGKETT